MSHAAESGGTHLNVQIRWHPLRPVTRYCEAPGCRSATRAGKPYCTEHIENLPYVKELMGLIARSETEEACVRQVGARAVDPEGLIASEILRCLAVHGRRSVPRLARDLNLTMEALVEYVLVLKQRRLVRVVSVRRRAEILALTDRARQDLHVLQISQPAAPARAVRKTREGAA